MSTQFCAKQFREQVKLLQFQDHFMLILSVLHLVFSLVATLGNLLVIRALWKASSIPANVRKLFLSLVFSDLAVGMLSQPMAGVIFAVMLKMASTGDYNYDSMCPTTLTLCNFFKFLLGCASFLNVTAIAVDRLFALLLHLRYQELVTSKRVNIALFSLWITSGVAASIFILLPEGNEIVLAIILFLGALLTTAAYIRIYKVVQHHQNQIQSLIQIHNAQAVELLRQKKSSYNTLFVYLVFLACYLPFCLSQILYITNSLRMSFLMTRQASFFLVLLNSSLNPLVYCWRYRTIREIVKSTVKKIFGMKEEGI